MLKMKDNDKSATGDEPVVLLENVIISNEGGVLLKDVNLRLDRGEFVYLIGKSGAGKTSLLRTLYAERPIDSGSAQVCGFDLAKMKRRNVPLLRRRIGIVFQNFRLLNDRNVYANLDFVLRATGWKKKAEIREQIEKTLQAVGIADKINAMPMQLSEGEQQRVGIARALINNPSLILADEPTGNLDTATSAEIISLLQMFNKKHHITIIMVTHDKETAGRVSHKTVLLSDGEIIKISTNPNP